MKAKLSKMLAAKWLTPDKDNNNKPESFLRSLTRRSLRVRRSKSLVVQEKRKSGKLTNYMNLSLTRSKH